MVQCPAHMPTRIAILQTAQQNTIQRGPGNHTQLTRLRNCSGQSPIGYAYAHPALNHDRQLQLRELFHQQNTILVGSIYVTVLMYLAMADRPILAISEWAELPQYYNGGPE